MCGGLFRLNLYDCGCKKAFAFAADVCYTVCEIEFYECQSACLSHTEVSPGGAKLPGRNSEGRATQTKN